MEKDELDGYGVEYYSNGDKYEGEWKNDEKDGYGIFYFLFGDKYEGEWKNNLFDGYGIYYFYYINWKYKGKWKNKFPNGYGILYFSKRILYEGKWNKIEKFGWLLKGILLILYFFCYLYKMHNKAIILILIFILINYFY